MSSLAAEREAALLATLLLDRPAALDPVLLLFEFCPLSVELFLHLAVSGVQLFFALLELGLFLLDLLLEDHLHLELHLGQLLLVQRSFLFLLDGWVDLLEHTRILGHTHGGKLVGSVVLVEEVVGVLLQLFHVSSDEHLS